MDASPGDRLLAEPANGTSQAADSRALLLVRKNLDGSPRAPFGATVRRVASLMATCTFF